MIVIVINKGATILKVLYYLLSNFWKVSYTISTSIFVDVLYWLPYYMDKFIFCVAPDSSKWLFHFGEEIVITWTHFGWVQWMLQNITLLAAQEVRDSNSCVTTCIVMKNDGVLYHQVSSFSPKRWTKVVLQERIVVGRVYHLPWRYSVVQYYPFNVICHNEHHLHSTLCTAMIRPRKSSPSLWYRSNKACTTA